MRLKLMIKSALLFVLCAVLFIVGLNLVPERRNVRQPIPHAFTVSDPQFLLTMGSVFEGSVMPGHVIDTLVNGDEIFPAMLEAIEGADDTVNFLTYIYWSGEIAERFAGALELWRKLGDDGLREAAYRGG